jgi:hypothetical protein
MRILRELHSRNLVPFKKRRGAYHIPGLTRETDELPIDKVEQDLSAEEQCFVRHYLAYADHFLKSVPQEQQQQVDEAVQPDKAENPPSNGAYKVQEEHRVQLQKKKKLIQDPPLTQSVSEVSPSQQSDASGEVA